MIFDVVTIFPELICEYKNYGVIKEAFIKNIAQLNIYNLRDFTKNKHRKVDDRPYGGGSGMIMMAQPFYDAVKFIKEKNQIKEKEKQKVVLLTPRGEKLNQDKLKYFSGIKNIILLCGRYEGVDERVSKSVVDIEISIGDYILSGGELPAMIILDGIIRLLPGVVHCKDSVKLESFENGLLEFPQYTRPPEFMGFKVPEVLIGGNHKEIKKWRDEQSVEITKKRRPDLFDKSF
ncbi:MAG: tRNA (guanosine(37)-N1)-methyltransferase TrmD [Actinomycetota bacterium]|nr:tRNA (guanosine(37)-N1)-methyltransferase TrmD [Actinomycetota bacterium]